MIKVITADNVNNALSDGLWWLKTAGVEEDSRNGRVLVAPGPVITEYLNPRERVLFSPLRDANPFFHFMEGLWMLAGRNDLEWPVYFNKRFSEYSDDGKTIHGAYGYRWRTHFGFDQLTSIAIELAADKRSRRAVLTMWDPINDSGIGSRDLPCNTHIYFDLRGGELNMTICCRSNDVLWGAYGANVVHMSMMQEVMAAWLGVPVGNYRQMSNNFHIYLDILPRDQMTELAGDSAEHNLYRSFNITPAVMVNVDIESWFEDLHKFMSDPLGDTAYAEPFFGNVAFPMYQAWALHKVKDYEDAIQIASEIAAHDWCAACVAWLKRRQDNAKAAA